MRVWEKRRLADVAGGRDNGRESGEVRSGATTAPEREVSRPETASRFR